MTERLDTSPPSIIRAAEWLRRGGLVAFPTETVYGLGAHALEADAVRRLFDAKGRPANDPLIVHVASADEARVLVAGDLAVARRLATRFWPGPLTLVLRKSASVPPEVTAGLDTVAIRVPAHPVARALLEAARIPIAAPSANLFSRPSPTRAEHVLHDLDGRIDAVIDGGPTPMGVESTVLDLTGAEPTLLRAGAVALEALREVLPRVNIRTGDSRSLPAGVYSAPGMMDRHYSPRTPMVLFAGRPEAALERLVLRARQAIATGQRVGVLLTTEDAKTLGDLPCQVAELGSESDLSTVAARLYAAMRDLDASGVDVILARDLPATGRGLGPAIRDRLRRAASEHVAVD